MRRTSLGALLALAVLGSAARADADEEGGSRYGLAPSAGVGAAVLTSPSPLPGFIGFTALGAELMGEITPWGGFARGDFLSSGNDGRWTALSFAAGGSRRIFGDVRHLSLVARAGLSYQHWHASTGGCDVLLFVPNGCKNFVAQPPPGTITTQPLIIDDNADAVGLVGGARLEMPFRAVYLAFDASFSPMVALEQPPGAAFELRLDVTLAFRDWPQDGRTAPGNKYHEQRHRY